MPDVYSIVTERILDQLSKGVVPWRKPWSARPARNLVSQKPYRGINPFLLNQGFASEFWLTFAQANRLGGHIRKGEKSSLIVFWKQSKFTKQNEETGEDETRSGFLLRYFNVFNLCQTEGIAEKLGLSITATLEPSFDKAQSIVDGMKQRPAIERADKAYYSPATDSVGMPDRGLFSSQGEYFSTLFHELTHATGHKSRLGRFDGNEKHLFGSESYSREELVAEFGASFLCGTAGIDQTMENSAAYIAHWSKRLREDKKLLVSAASQAQKSADFILGANQTETKKE